MRHRLQICRSFIPSAKMEAQQRLTYTYTYIYNLLYTLLYRHRIYDRNRTDRRMVRGAGSV